MSEKRPMRPVAASGNGNGVDAWSASGGSPPPNGWGNPITRLRAAELGNRLRNWVNDPVHTTHRGPFDGFTLTGADVFWLAASAFASAANLSQDHAEHSLREATLDPQDRDALSLALQLQGAKLAEADLRGAVLPGAHFEGAFLGGADLRDATLVRATFDRTTRLDDAILDGTLLDQAILSDTNLALINWEEVRELGDERWANQRKKRTISYETGSSVPGEKRKTAQERFEQYTAAARAYRLLSVALRNQGLTRAATRFQHRAYVMDRRALSNDIRLRAHSPRKAISVLYYLPRWAVSLSLDVVAGYGVFYLWRLFLTYVVVVVGFAIGYYAQAHTPLRFPRTWREAFDCVALSVTAFHGRGIQPASLAIVGGRMEALTMMEAVIGLLLEGLFIASFTRRVIGN